MDKIDALFSTLNDLNRKLSEVDKHTAVHAEKMAQVEKHLQTMNGRIGRAEDRLSTLETIRSEMRGGWKAISAIAATIGALASWALEHWKP